MSSRPAPWRLFAVAQACSDGARTCNEMSIVLGVSKARVQMALEHLHAEGYLTRVRRVRSGHGGTVYYEYSVARMPVYAEPPLGAKQTRDLQADTFGPNPLRELLEAVGCRQSVVPVGTVSRKHHLDI